MGRNAKETIKKFGPTAYQDSENPDEQFNALQSSQKCENILSVEVRNDLNRREARVARNVRHVRKRRNLDKKERKCRKNRRSD